MINAVYADHDTFKRVDFGKGFNVVLAERTETASSRDSRNGSGKSSLLEIIHFCLGSSANRNVLMKDQLKHWTFFVDISLRGKDYTISRSINSPANVDIQGDTSYWPIKPRTSGRMSVKDMNEVLGWLMFELPIGDNAEPYSPTYRSLISYFARKGSDGFSTPFEHFRKQREWEKQVANAFLLGLSWEDAQKWQELKDKQDGLTQLVGATKAGLVSALWGSMGELETRKVQLMSDAEGFRTQLRDFKVHPQYQDIEIRASQITARIHELSNANVSDRRMSEFYKESLGVEKAAQPNSIAQVYKEAGIILPDLAMKRLEDVLAFHDNIVANRKTFLENEIKSYEKLVAERDLQIKGLSNERAELMGILQTHGALEEHTLLQDRLNVVLNELERVRNQIENIRRIDEMRVDLKLAEAELERKSRADYDERAAVRDRAIAIFNDTSQSMYESPGRLIIDIGKTGFKFDVKMPRSTSQGIEKMKIFCYDLMLAQLWAERRTAPGFLIHDSTLFDGVDERQFAKALELASSRAEQKRFQYICCLNSDVIPWNDFSETFDITSYKVLELTDQENGGIFGFRF